MADQPTFETRLENSIIELESIGAPEAPYGSAHLLRGLNSAIEIIRDAEASGEVDQLVAVSRRLEATRRAGALAAANTDNVTSVNLENNAKILETLLAVLSTPPEKPVTKADTSARKTSGAKS